MLRSYMRLVLLLLIWTLNLAASCCQAGLFSGNDYDTINSFLEKQQIKWDGEFRPKSLMSSLAEWRNSEAKLEETTKTREQLIRSLDQLLELSGTLDKDTRCTRESIEILKKNDAAAGANIYSADKSVWQKLSGGANKLVQKLVRHFAMEHYSQCKEIYPERIASRLKTAGDTSQAMRAIQPFVRGVVLSHVLSGNYPHTLDFPAQVTLSRPQVQKPALEVNSIGGLKDAVAAYDAIQWSLGPAAAERRLIDPIHESTWLRSTSARANSEAIDQLIVERLVKPCELYNRELADILAPAETELLLESKLDERITSKSYVHVLYYRICRILIHDERHKLLAADVVDFISRKRRD